MRAAVGLALVLAACNQGPPGPFVLSCPAPANLTVSAPAPAPTAELTPLDDLRAQAAILEGQAGAYVGGPGDRVAAVYRLTDLTVAMKKKVAIATFAPPSRRKTALRDARLAVEELRGYLAEVAPKAP